MRAQESEFYDSLFKEPHDATGFAHSESAEEHWIYTALSDFLAEHDLIDKKCLEVGSGYGQFGRLAPDYVAMDLAYSAGQYVGARFVNASATTLPFRSGTFDVVWTNHVLEHVSEPELMLQEIWRVLKPGGFLFLVASWQCGPWLSEGYPVRPYSDFGLKGKLIKLFVPIRASLPYRAIKIMPRRLMTLISRLAVRGAVPLSFKRLAPNYGHRWMADSTAASSVEPFDVYMWFTTRGATCLNYPNRLSGFLIRTGHLTFRKPQADRL